LIPAIVGYQIFTMNINQFETLKYGVITAFYAAVFIIIINIIITYVGLPVIIQTIEEILTYFKLK
jgi:hypothetical protein